MGNHSRGSYVPGSKDTSLADSASADISRESVQLPCRTTTPRSATCSHGCESSAETLHTQTTGHTTLDSRHTRRHSRAHRSDLAAEYGPAYAPQANTATHRYPYSSKASPTQQS